ncbi:hypothetical protein BDN67DRAFT_131275 [Paxillus ammoniavirescens]|nr:hypothetical protein BDN67DRAFT_131275 [Paxillus ammoniavirescens]
MPTMVDTLYRSHRHSQYLIPSLPMPHFAAGLSSLPNFDFARSRSLFRFIHLSVLLSSRIAPLFALALSRAMFSFPRFFRVDQHSFPIRSLGSPSPSTSKSPTSLLWWTFSHQKSNR